MYFLILKRYCTLGCLYMYHHLCLLLSAGILFLDFCYFFPWIRMNSALLCSLNMLRRKIHTYVLKRCVKIQGFFLQNQGRSQKKLMTEAISPWLSSLRRYLLVRVFMTTIKQQKWMKWLRPQLTCYWLFKGQKIMPGINSWNLLVF